MRAVRHHNFIAYRWPTALAIARTSGKQAAAGLRTISSTPGWSATIRRKLDALNSSAAARRRVGRADPVLGRTRRLGTSMSGRMTISASTRPHLAGPLWTAAWRDLTLPGRKIAGWFRPSKWLQHEHSRLTACQNSGALIADLGSRWRWGKQGVASADEWMMSSVPRAMRQRSRSPSPPENSA